MLIRKVNQMGTISNHLIDHPNSDDISEFFVKEPRKEPTNVGFEMDIRSLEIQIANTKKLDTLIENAKESSKVGKRTCWIGCLTLIVAFLTLLVSILALLRDNKESPHASFNKTTGCENSAFTPSPMCGVSGVKTLNNNVRKIQLRND